MSTPDQSVRIVEFTDPGCPFAFSAEPHRLRLHWIYGEQLQWSTRMIGIAESREANAEKGVEPEMIARQAKGLVEQFAMPLFVGVRAAVPATWPACRAVVAVRLRAPLSEWPFLRRLRVRAMGGGMLDESILIDEAAGDVGIEAPDLHRWMTEPDVAAEFEEDLRLARDPTVEALALPAKLARTPDGMRYTPPSYVLSTTERSSTVPGMQNALAYETALANLAPHLQRRPGPEDVVDVLRWAGYPLATQEVAEVCGIRREDARQRLAAAEVGYVPVATDGYWHL